MRIFLCMVFFFVFNVYNGACQDKITVGEAINARYMTPSNSWQPLKFGQQVYPNTSIKVEPGGSLVLLKNSASSCISKNTATVIKQVNELYFKEGDSFFAKMCDALYSWVMPHEDITSTVYKRGAYLMLFPASNEVLLKSDCDFIWRRDGRATFDLFITDESHKDNWLCKKEKLTDTALRASVATACRPMDKFTEGRSYYWTVNPSGDQNEEGYFTKFTVASKETEAELRKALAALERSKPGVDEHTYQMLLALCYEHFKMYTMEYITYENAVKQYPESEMIKKGRSDFMQKVIAMNQPQK